MTNEEQRPAAYDSVLLSMYSAVSDPELFWETLQLFESVSDAGIDTPSDTTISQHAQRLNDLLRMAKEPNDNGATTDDAWTLRFDQNGHITQLGEEFAVMDLSDIWDLPLAQDDVGRLRQYLKHAEPRQIVVILPSIDGKSSRVAQILSEDRKTFSLKIVRLSLPPTAESLFAQNFGVSRAQFRVLECLVTGNSVADIADQLGRSVETIRSHIKALSDKLYVRSQSELVSRALSIPIQTLTAPSLNQMDVEGHVIDSDGSRIQYVSSGDESGYPVLFFQHATHGPFVTEAFHKNLCQAGLRLISIARPGSGETVVSASSSTSFAECSAALLHTVCQHLNVEPAKMLSVGTGLPHALTYAHKFRPDAEILAVNPFPPFVSREDRQSLPGRWRSYAYVAKNAPIMVRPLVSVACQLYEKNPDVHAKKILSEEVRIDVDDGRRVDMKDTLKRNMQINARHQAKHYWDEAKLLCDDWASSARTMCPDVKIHLVQGSGHFAISERAFAQLATRLPNASSEVLAAPIDPLHLLHSDWICDRLSRKR
ncbi:MAG: LuxR C-terminal-related transcriptional regulator [Aliishimia sp.]